MKSRVPIVCFIGGVLLSPLQGWAQPYSIDWYKIAGGGSTSTGGVYAVTGTIGQHDASSPMLGGQYAVTGGFWALIQVVQTAGLPNLSITRAGNNVTISWPATGNYILLQTPSLGSGIWTTNTSSVTTVNGINSVAVTLPLGNLFFRLRSP